MTLFISICFSLILLAFMAYSIYALIKTVRELDKNYWSYNEEELDWMAIRIIFCGIRLSISIVLVLMNVFGIIRINII